MIQRLCSKIKASCRFASKTDADVINVLMDAESKLQSRLESVETLRRSVWSSQAMLQAKGKIADRLGLNRWIDMSVDAVAVTKDGQRQWREREKQRQQEKQTLPREASTGQVFPGSHVDLHQMETTKIESPNCSISNVTIEFSRFQANGSFLDSSSNNPDFLLDLSAHNP